MDLTGFNITWIFHEIDMIWLASHDLMVIQPENIETSWCHSSPTETGF